MRVITFRKDSREGTHIQEAPEGRHADAHSVSAHLINHRLSHLRGGGRYFQSQLSAVGSIKRSYY